VAGALVSDRLSPSDEVSAALDGGGAVVALETSVLGQGLPEPWNGRAAEGMDKAARHAGAVPAWIWASDGSVRLGASMEDLRRLMDGSPAKVARRDLPPVLASGGLGATTVSAAVWAAHRAAVEVAATGGIGGVHPGTGDVSADLLELARTPGTLVCSGPKSILDPAATLERLEELGVGVLGFRTDRLPFFVGGLADLPLEHAAADVDEVAGVIRTRRDLGVDSTLLVCNPCPPEAALGPEETAAAVARCRERHRDVTGKAVTPGLLGCLAEETGGVSLRANLALLESNAALAARIAVALA
jgi:pseudouridine-5'-phosphate glycosidase